MIHFEREVKEKELIAAILDEIHILNLGMNDEDGIPYVVPLNFGFEINENQLIVYTHFMKRGKKIELLRKDPRVALAFNIFNDFPDKKYKGHYHDYRSVMAKGTMHILDYSDEPELWEHGYNLLYLCNHREIKPLNLREKIPAMYIGMITCDLKDVTAKSEFPIRKKEDAPFLDVYSMEEDLEPFDISDIIEKNKKSI